MAPLPHILTKTIRHTTTRHIHELWLNVTPATTCHAPVAQIPRQPTRSLLRDLMKDLKKCMTALSAHVAPAITLARRVSSVIASNLAFLTTLPASLQLITPLCRSPLRHPTSSPQLYRSLQLPQVLPRIPGPLRLCRSSRQSLGLIAFHAATPSLPALPALAVSPAVNVIMHTQPLHDSNSAAPSVVITLATPAPHPSVAFAVSHGFPPIPPRLF